MLEKVSAENNNSDIRFLAEKNISPSRLSNNLKLYVDVNVDELSITIYCSHFTMNAPSHAHRPSPSRAELCCSVCSVTSPASTSRGPTGAGARYSLWHREHSTTFSLPTPVRLQSPDLGKHYVGILHFLNMTENEEWFRYSVYILHETFSEQISTCSSVPPPAVYKSCGSMR